MNKRWIKLTGLVGLILLLLWWAFSLTGEDDYADILIQPLRGPFEVTVTVTGELRAKNSTEIKGPSNARKVRIWEMKISKLIPEGTVVKLGDFVAELDRSLEFYCGVLGFELVQRMGTKAAFVSAGGYHHHIGLNTWHSRGAEPPPQNSTGLYHVAILYPSRAALADALRRILDAHVRLDGASDHGVSEALYLNDPDQNGLELYWDRPEEQWPRDRYGNIQMVTETLDIWELMREAR